MDPTRTVDAPPAVRPDIDVEPTALARPTPPDAPRTQVVRELPKPSQQETVSILRYSEDHLGDLFGALAEAQGEFGEIERTLRANIESKRTGAKYSYDYAPLDEVLQAVRPATSKHGLSIQQFPAVGNGYVVVRTLLGHKSGGWMANDLRMPCDTSGPQEVGSGITFARRYSLQPILGVAPSVDDDGAAAGPKGDPPRAGQRRSAQGPDPAAGSGTAPPVQPPPTPARSRPTKPANNGATAAVGASPPAGSTSPSPAVPVPPTASQARPADPAPVGRIADFAERPNGALITLDTGFRAASKDAETTKALRVHHDVGATVRLTTRPSSDPTRFAPVITAIEIVKAVRSREPGEEG